MSKRGYRVEATVPAIQWVEATSEEEAKKIACANRSGWDIILDADIEEEHIVDVEADEEPKETLAELIELPKDD